MDIRCRRTLCEHNKGHTCFAGFVDVNNHAVCKSFEKDNQKDEVKKDFTKNMFEKTPEYENFRHIKNVRLKCDATRCLFNSNGRCRANGITVVDDHEKSRCASFIQDI